MAEISLTDPEGCNMISRISYAVLGVAMIGAQLHAAPTYADDRKAILALRAESGTCRS